jgi:hypothetical protein
MTNSSIMINIEKKYGKYWFSHSTSRGESMTEMMFLFGSDADDPLTPL